MNTDRRYGVAGNLGFKAPCICATTAAITLSGLQTVDGVTVASGDRVLVKNQADQTTNGIYVADTGTWVRDTDFDGALDVTNGTIVYIALGSTYSRKGFMLTSTNSITIGSSNIIFTQI